jgi:hypothetical protein
MTRCAFGLLIGWIVVLSAAPAEAQWMTGAQTAYRRNQAWPEPFLMPDRAAVCTPFTIQVANGWRRQNLMSDYHFNEETNQLTASGEIKVRFILTQMPPQRRTIFVQRGLTPEVTATRVAVVENAAGRSGPPGSIAAVVESDLPNDGWPADEIDAVTRRWNSTRPDPRLKSVSGADSTSNGNGGSAN